MLKSSRRRRYQAETRKYFLQILLRTTFLLWSPLLNFCEALFRTFGRWVTLRPIIASTPKANSHRAKTEAKAKIFFDVCRLFFDLFQYYHGRSCLTVKLGCARFPENWTFFKWTQRNWEFRRNRKWSLNRQFQCKSMKNYRAQTPQNLALTEILQNFRKTSTPLGSG